MINVKCKQKRNHNWRKERPAREEKLVVLRWLIPYPDAVTFISVFYFMSFSPSHADFYLFYEPTPADTHDIHAGKRL